MNYKQVSDMELLQYCRKDDTRAFNELFDRYAPKLYRLGKRYTKNRFVIEELALDLLLNIWQRRHNLNIEKGSFSAYLFTSMHYKLLDYMAKPIPPVVDISEYPENSFESSFKTDSSLLFEEAENQYLENLNRLSPQRRKVFELSREYQLSYAEIAHQLNLSINTVENHMQAALSQLRKQYEENPLISLWVIALLLPLFF